MIVLLIIEDLQSVVRVTCMTVTYEVYTSIFMLIQTFVDFHLKKSPSIFPDQGRIQYKFLFNYICTSNNSTLRILVSWF